MPASARLQSAPKPLLEPVFRAGPTHRKARPRPPLSNIRRSLYARSQVLGGRASEGPEPASISIFFWSVWTGVRRFAQVPGDELPDDLILAALDRARRHDAQGRSVVSYPALVAHLGLPMGSATGRHLRPRIRELEATGIVGTAKRNGVVVYELTRRGERRLRALGDLILPESPQHRAWRVAQDAARASLGGFREDVRVLLRDGEALLASDAAGSEDWFVLGERLSRACSRVGSATHCLREWAEPGDDAPDVDVDPRLGRRNIGLWN